MDKKAKYQQQHQACKSSSTEAKRSQDGINSRPSKSSQRYKPINSSNIPKNDYKRSNAQKTQNADKRPKSKGQCHGSSKEGSKVMEYDSAEHGSVMVQRNKKPNINQNLTDIQHLVNFRYESRMLNHYSNNNRSSNQSHHHKYNKEAFLLSNCQFIVPDDRDYSVFLNDSNKLVDWALIQQIRLRSSEYPICPICMYPPVAAKITKCCHVYCWHCILQYLSVKKEEGKQAHCPICYNSVIHKHDLKSVSVITDQVLNVGDTVILQLMRREKKTNVAVAVDDIMSTPTTKFLSIAESKKQAVSKLLLAEKNDILNILESERNELKALLGEADHQPTTEDFIQMALKELEYKEAILFEDLDKFQDITIGGKVQGNCGNFTDDQGNKPIIDEKKSVKDESLNFLNDSTIPDKHLQNNVNANVEKCYYFYQANDGQNIYLHPMNIDMLIQEYGSLENSPKMIEGTVLEKKYECYTEESRHRIRYLEHLPLCSVYEIVEIDMQSLISANVWKKFETQIREKQYKRKKREHAERRREKKIAEVENKRMGKYPTPDIHLESRTDFPEFSPEEFDSLQQMDYNTSINASIPSMNSFSSSSSSVNEGNANSVWMAKDSGPSYAQIGASARPTAGSYRRVSSNFTPPTDEDVDPEMEEYMAPIRGSHTFNLGDAVNLAALKNGNQKKKKKGKTTYTPLELFH
ncbi:RING finger protein 10 isoform X1 [Trichogramma pretiosum]|uniref:RING finger protein 10 isoform X1 n=1 Tax=Trichogramma pretiosum TaxID=7493 RepID=UPI0006C9D9E6|nr:RING finger protein 10 isoform X1 [Trichogramma pretiosum]